jgi:hypothetical protein
MYSIEKANEVVLSESSTKELFGIALGKIYKQN